MNHPLVNRTLTPPDKGGSQWEEQDKIEATLEWVRASFKPEQVFDLYDHDKEVSIAFKTFVSKYMNGEITEDEPNREISDDDLWDLFIQ